MDDPEEMLNNPENYLWVRLNYLDPTSRCFGGLTALDRDRLNEIKNGAVPEGEVEELLAKNLVWLRIYLAHVIGDHVITINIREPLPMWNTDSFT